MTRTLAQRISEGGYDGYAYAYPHKTAYRPFQPALPLDRVWQNEDRNNLFLYVHLPFCEMRCGFCNLFTTVNPGETLVSQTLAAIVRQSTTVAQTVSPRSVAQAAFGGGTPSFLSEQEIETLLRQLACSWPVSWEQIPVSFEVSPGTVTPSKLALLKQLGVDRISLGVQSFVPEDLISLKRPQPAGQLKNACQLIKAADLPVFNVDLIYGNEGQDRQRWQKSLDQALEWQPEELYIYPLYVGKLTNLDRVGKKPGQHRRDLYEQARDFLCSAGYRQLSMRLFRRADVRRPTDYCCQEDGMIGLGPGARSYTRSLHYSTEYAVGQPGVKAIIESFNTQAADSYGRAHYGTFLNREEQKRRFVIKSLLRSEGLVIATYQRFFNSELHDDLPQLSELFELGLADARAGVLQLNSAGLAHSDTIGPWLYSDAVTATMNAYEFA